MFKKGVAVSQKRQASGKDLKQLKKDIQVWRSVHTENVKVVWPLDTNYEI